MSVQAQRELFWCMVKLENLSNLFAAGFQTSSIKRLVYWGYLLGRTSQLLKELNIKKYWTDKISNMTVTKVVWFLRGKLTPDNPKVLINFGFGVGFCQEFFRENAKKWWNPLVPHLMDQTVDLVEAQRITLENLPKLENWGLFQIDSIPDPTLTLDWMEIAEELRKEHHKIRIMLKWEEDTKAPQIPGKVLLCKL